MAKADWHTVTIDCQHGMVDLGQAMNMIQAVAATGKVTMCRVPWNDPTWIMKFLDAGALGIACPMVNNRSEAEAFVGACRLCTSRQPQLGAGAHTLRQSARVQGLG